MITFEEKALNNFPICRLSNVKNDNIPIAILKMLFACTFITTCMCYYRDVGAIFLMLTTLI